MEKQEYLELIKKSAEEWNAWREQNPRAIPELCDLDLSSLKLKDINFKKVMLCRANFRNAYLREANFESANLEKAVFRMADMGSANLQFANLYKSNFRRADLWKANFSFANLKAANMGKAIMQEINFEGANLERAILQEANLRGANFRGADLRDADLSGANLQGANFEDARLENTKLDNAIVKDTILDKKGAPPAAPPVSEEKKEKTERAPASPSPPSPPVTYAGHPPGSLVGTYEIKEKIARGGMGVVYRAVDRSLEREVAIKILSSELKENPEYLQRFLQEARITAQMDHPNIINIYSISQEKGDYYVAMQYIRGKTISQYLREKGAFSFEEGLSIVRCVASALAYAHKQGLIHRDIKPDNIMIDENRRVRVMDFGIARDLSIKTRITQDGHFMGTIHYSAPEQWSSDVPDPRSDIYSLGIVFYEMLTGKIPFDADSPMNLLYKITREKPTPIKDLRPDTPHEIAQIIDRMIAKDLHERYFSADQIVEDIDRINEKRELPLEEEEECISLADLDMLLKEKVSSEDFINTPTNLLIMLEEMEFSAKHKKKFLKLIGDDVYSKKLGSGWFYVIFQETLIHNTGKKQFHEMFPVLSRAKKGKSLTEEEVVMLKKEIEQAEKILEGLPLTEIWTLSIDMKTKDTIPKKIQEHELQKVISEYYESKTAAGFKSLKDFFEPILSAYYDVCRKAIDNRTGASWK